MHRKSAILVSAVGLLMVSSVSAGPSQLSRDVALRMLKQRFDAPMGGYLLGNFRRSEQGAVSGVVRISWAKLGDQFRPPIVLDIINPISGTWHEVATLLNEREVHFSGEAYARYMQLRCLAAKKLITGLRFLPNKKETTGDPVYDATFTLTKPFLKLVVREEPAFLGFERQIVFIVARREVLSIFEFSFTDVMGTQAQGAFTWRLVSPNTAYRCALWMTQAVTLKGSGGGLYRREAWSSPSSVSYIGFFDALLLGSNWQISPDRFNHGWNYAGRKWPDPPDLIIALR